MFRPDVLDPTVDFLAELAGNGPALELGIGTGRVALPLVARGISVHGIDLSPAMVERLQAKPGGDAVEVTIGDFATTRVEGDFFLAYLVFNTITNLTTEDAQVECFANVAQHLEPGGRFVIENFIPALHRLQPGEKVVPIQVTPPGSTSTNTTSRTRPWSRTTTGWSKANSKSCRPLTGMCGPPNWISWPDTPA